MTKEELFKTQYGLFYMDPEFDSKFIPVNGSFHHAGILELLKPYITESSVIFDVGGHIGTFSIPLSYHAKLVRAFEPAIRSYSLLRKNIEINKITNVETFNVGIGETASTAELADVKTNNSGAQTLRLSQSNEGSIQIRPLSMFAPSEGKVSLLKIDVEGMEESVLKGAEELIARDKPVICIEVSLHALRSNGSSPSVIQKRLRRHGYEFYLPLKVQAEYQLFRIKNLQFLTLVLSPRSFLFGGDSYGFDALAFPKDYPIQAETFSWMRLLKKLITKKVLGRF